MVIWNEVLICEDGLVSVLELDISVEDTGVEVTAVEGLLD